MTDKIAGGFKITGRYEKKDEVYFKPVGDTIPSINHEEGYSAQIRYDRIKDSVYLIIENGISEKAIEVWGITKDAGLDIIEKLKQDKRTADIVYENKKGVKNVRIEDIYASIEKSYSRIKLRRATERIKRGEEVGNLEIALEEVPEQEKTEDIVFGFEKEE